ncbi:HlyD family efflux transporter periplasmic adaptor subunit [Luteibacter flocculans]|uniref:HlyD family efflux transporter periplasmic adaptor subunit n=1 Tax=Luteibacter flocculans TaxID=2780091 RepID=A0ABY4T1T6_9GAMM|nr:HlyD family efflux transporter periplasmic adaptor subunit [Luteibacter flocculans]URL56889.1 HlyD family efflux transporter periplasmic adaptor subunit [Luteibacter flocculans]
MMAAVADPGMLAAAPPPWPGLRDDLKIHPSGRNRDGSPAWHLSDPVRNQFFRIGWLEFEMLQHWGLGDPQRIAEAIAARTTLAPEADDVLDFARFLQQQQLTRMAQPKRNASALHWLLQNYLFIRIPLVRPERFLRRALPYVQWMFGMRFLVATLLAAVMGLLLAARQWDAVQANLHGAMSWEGVIAFAGALVFSKCWHEFGHAFMATRYGVRVGHMGVALLVMWPMAYTDTGESWKLEGSRRRLAIASAGVMAELVLAAWCTLLWSFAPEGNFKNALFFLGTTAWVLTVAVNASPFMRFDGYFILADALDYPGLHERAGRWAKRWVRRALLGIEDPRPDAVSPRFAAFLTAFAFATWLYRLVLFVGIAVVVYHAFFKALGLILFLVEIVTFVGKPMLNEVRVWWMRRAEISRPRLHRWLAVLGALALVLLVPWSSSITGDGVVEAGFEQPVFTPFAARMERVAIVDGAKVTAGQVLFELSAPAPEDDGAKADALREAYEATARGAGALDRDGVAKQVVAERMADQYDVQRRASTAELHRLRLAASEDGVIRDLDPTLRPGSWVSPGSRIATVVGGTRWRAEVLVSESDRARLVPGAVATVYPHGRWQPLRGRVVAVDDGALEHLPSLMLAKNHGGPIPLNPTAPAKDLRPASVWYRVRVEGDGLSGPLAAEELATVRLEGHRESLGRRWIDSALLILLQQTGLGKEG